MSAFQGSELAEEALRRSEERYRDLVENANDIIYTHDLAGNLTSWNQAGEHILGYSVDEAVGMNISRLLPPDQLQLAREMTARKVDQGGRTAYELDVLTKDGRRVTMEISSRISNQPGQAPQVHGMARDVTERKRAVDALREADRRKDEFLAILAHELRNPLAPLCNGLEILRLGGDNAASIARIRDMMTRQVQHLVRLVDDLLDVSRITRGRVELHLERLDVASAVQSALETSKPLLDAAKHQVTCRWPPGAIFVKGDKVRLAQVFANLLNNSAKYTPGGGQIYVSVEQTDRLALIRIGDNGLGIPPEMLHSIFEMFTQVDKSLHRAQGGLGIGLTLVRNLVEMHGGSVEARSAGLGHGSEFIVRLPLSDPTAVPLPVQDFQGAGIRKRSGPTRRLLVVDDNVDSAESLAMMLRMTGHEVRTAHDGPSALEMVIGFKPDALLLDIGMPGMDGHELARRLRALPEVGTALFIAQSGWGQEDDLRRSREAGFDHHLVKPIDVPALQELLI
jgi:PAS domain S-box-containing protein